MLCEPSVVGSMTHIAFAISTVILWVGINFIWSLAQRGDDADTESDFDMTVEMSRSGGYSLRLIVTGICSALVVLIAFITFDLI